MIIEIALGIILAFWGIIVSLGIAHLLHLGDWNDSRRNVLYGNSLWGSILIITRRKEMKRKDKWYYVSQKDLLQDMTDAEEAALQWELELRKQEMRKNRKEKRNELYNYA